MTATELKDMMRKTKKDVVRIDMVNEPVEITSSKLGGQPYWPANTDPPKNMLFLAQINFSEIPKTELLPEKGILQFFVEDENCFGLFNGDSGYKIVYHENPENPPNTVELPEAEYTPIIIPAKLKFALDTEMMTYSDYRFPADIDDIEDLYDSFDYSGDGCKMLGYPFFTQTDPRTYHADQAKYDTLLFQLDSNDFIMWGDMGVANFFINEEKLRAKDFSDILYNWDCC